MELPNWLDIASRNHPAKVALEFGDARWTFAALRTRVEQAAKTIAAAMPDRTGRIGILSGNRPGFVVAVHAAMNLGVPFVPLNWRLSAAELAWQIEDAAITLLISDHALGNEKAPQSSRRMAVIPIADLERAPPKRPPSPCAQGRAPSGRRLGVRVDLNAETAILYTSGTSGRPKGAILTYGNLWFAAIASALHLGHRSDDVWLATMPLFHVGGLAILVRGVIGATPVVLHDRFDPERAVEAIEDGATLVSLVPAMLDRMLAARGGAPWPPRLRCILLGGSAAPPRLLEQCLRLGVPVAPTYGLTEATSQVTTLLPEHVSSRFGSSGLALPLTELRIMTAQGVGANGDLGEIEIRGPTVFSGYLAEAGRRDPNGWFATGDVGYLDDDGYLFVVDRRDDLIVSGGENIYPAEIERVLRSHPLVADAGVVGVPDESWGARPVAAIVWDGDPALAEAMLLRHCTRELSRYKIPDRFVLVPELPRSPSGKLLRRALRARLAPAASD